MRLCSIILVTMVVHRLDTWVDNEDYTERKIELLEDGESLTKHLESEVNA